jgi:hypothetical protein
MLLLHRWSKAKIALDIGQAKMALRGMHTLHLKLCEHYVFVGDSDRGVTERAMR